MFFQLSIHIEKTKRFPHTHLISSKERQKERQKRNPNKQKKIQVDNNNQHFEIIK